MNSTNYSPAAAVAVGIAAVALATVLRLALDSSLGGGSYFIFYFPAVVVSAWFSGALGGGLATLLSAISAGYFLFPPRSSFSTADEGSIITLGVFMVGGVLISALAENLHRTIRLASAEEEIANRQREQLHVAQEQFRENTRRLRLLIDSLPVLISYIDEDSNYLLNNKAYEEWFQLSRDKMVGRHMSDVLGAEAYAQLKPYVTRALAGETVQFETEVDYGIAGVREISGTYVPDQQPDGSVHGFFVLVSDVSERKRADAALQAAHRRATDILGNMSEAYFSLDSNWNFTNFNPRAENFLGAGRTEIIGKNLWELYPQIAGTRYASELRKTAATGEPVHFETKSLVSEKWFEVNMFSSEEGVSVYFRDISERKQSEDELRSSEERFRTLASSVPVFVWMTGTDKLAFFFNEPWYEFTGRTPEQEYGFGWTEGLHPDDVDQSIATFVAAFEAREEFEMEYRIRRYDGAYRWILDRGVPLHGAGGVFTGYIGSCVDITERKRVEAERELLLSREQEARHQAEDTSRLKDEFLATVSHELRTPLNAMLGWATLLRDGNLNAEKTARAVEVIERNVRAQAQLVEDILDVSRIITGRLRLESRPFEVAPVVEAALDAVRPAADAREISLRMALSPDVGLILGDAGRLQQVVWNLLSNAVKFTPRGGLVRVSLSRADGQVCISVKDTGQGISPEFLPFVFDRFRQADSSTTRSFGGLGLGLSIVRHLVELQGGTVTAESDGAGTGATFTVRLPVSSAAQIDEDENRDITNVHNDAPALSSSPSLDGVSVLLVDDEPDARVLLSEVLASCGAEVRVAASAAEALGILAAWRPSVIVSDIGMPEQDGYALIRKVRADERLSGTWTPALALTAYARAEDRIRALTAGYQMHLTKPVRPLELQSAVAGLAGGSPSRASASM